MFQARIVKERLAGHPFPPDLSERHAILRRWVLALRAGKLDRAKEVSLHGDFLGDVFGRALGYQTLTTSGSGSWELSAERSMGGGGKSADGALGFFGHGSPDVVIAPIELKGARQSLDHALGRVLTPVQQAWDYANHSPGCRWILVSNYRETRLYSTARTPDTYERFLLEEMESPEAFKRLYFLLCRDHLLPPAPGARSTGEDLLLASEKEEARITRQLYEDYRDLRKRLFQDLCRRHSNVPKEEILRHTQTVLDRILFIAFAEDRGLLPENVIDDACSHRDRYRPAPIWKNFCTVFGWINNGYEPERYPAYNGGLFREDENIQDLDVTDEMCAEFKKLAAYDYRDDVSVDVLGHIFEQSITDLEELRGSSGIVLSPAKLSRRKTEGIFYTPAFVTRFIVDQTLGRLFDERWRAVLEARKPEERRLKEGSAAWNSAWTGVYEDYREEIKKVRVLDLSCGSGAFLIAAFDALSREYDRVNAALAELNRGQSTIFDLTKTVLNNNLFGVDVNAESVDITKLSLWLKTAERGRKLTYLDSNVKWGNSIVRDPMLDVLAFDWKTGDHVKSIFDPPSAPEATEINARWREGFDIVIGNPPYVRHELLGKIKDHLEHAYRAYHGMADLYVYFFERGLSVLKPGGRLGFIVTNKWLKSGYAEPLRGMLAKEASIETIVDFGHAPIFPDADTFPCIVTLNRGGLADGSTPAEQDVEVTSFPREELQETTVEDYVKRHSYRVPQGRLGAEEWNLEPPDCDALYRKIRSAGQDLSAFSGTKPHYGIKTGCNEAFLIASATRDALVQGSQTSASLLKRFLRGQDIGRWRGQWNQLWIVLIESSGDREWPWKGLEEGAAEEVFSRAFPAVHAHVKEHEAALRKRWDKGRYWWELRSCAYYEALNQPKLLYQEIQFHPAYSLDTDGMLLNNKVFFLPNPDLWLLAVLNSPLLWWFCWRFLPHMKDETLSPVGVKMESLPIAPPSRAAREQAEAAVTRLVEIKRAENSSRAAVLDSLRMQFDVHEPGQKLLDFASLETDTFVKEVLKRRPKASGKLRAADMKALRDLYGDEALPIQTARREALSLERRLSALVNEAYGLSAEEEALMWRTAPPRMPFKPT
ncbi:MAG: Eco57I restriction-modification methylase domain-containing protein [Polyangiaceae bacterium]